MTIFYKLYLKNINKLDQCICQNIKNSIDYQNIKNEILPSLNKLFNY